MSMELLGEVLAQIGVSDGPPAPGARLRATLGLDSVETTELELQLSQRFGLDIDLWDATDYSLAELAALMDGAGGAGAAGDKTGVPRVPAEAARRYRDAGWWRPEPLDA